MAFKKLYLIWDLDDSFFEWSRDFDDCFESTYPGLDFDRGPQRTRFNMYSGKNALLRPQIDSIMNKSGFYRHLRPRDGAVEAVREQIAEGHDVSFCTSPWLTNPTCADDKLRNIGDVLGIEFEGRVTVSKDKTRFRGDILFDDKPDIAGSMMPEWTQILVDQAHNQHVTHLPRIVDLSQWRTYVDEYMDTGRITPQLVAA